MKAQRSSRIFKTKWFHRFARKEQIEDTALLDAVACADQGLVAANLGGGVIKQRIARRGQGKSGGYRAIVVYRRGDRAIFMYGFGKNERDNLQPDEENQFKAAAKHLLAVTDQQLTDLVNAGEFVEVIRS